MEDQRQRTDLAPSSISFFPKGNNAVVQKIISSFPHLPKVEKILHIPPAFPHFKLKIFELLP